MGLSRAPGPPGHRLAPTRPRQPPSWGCFLGTGHGSSSEGDVVGARRGPEQNKEALTAKVPGNHSGARAKYFHREVSAPQPGRRQPPRHGCRPKRMLGPPPGCSDPPGMCPAGSPPSGWQRGGPKRRALEVPGPKDVPIGVVAGCLARIWGAGKAGSTPRDLGDLVSVGDAGMIPIGWVLFPNLRAAFLRGCSMVPQHPPRGAHPHVPTTAGSGRPFPWGPAPICPRSPPRPGSVCVPHPLQAGTVGVCPSSVSILDFPVRSPLPSSTDGAFIAWGPAGPSAPPQKKKQKTLPGQAGLLLPYKPGHSAGITAISGSGVWVLCCGVVWRGLCSPPGNAGGLLTPLFGVNLAPGSATGSLGGHPPGGCSPTKPSPDPSQPHRMGARPCRVPTRACGVYGGVGGSA